MSVYEEVRAAFMEAFAGYHTAMDNLAKGMVSVADADKEVERECSRVYRACKKVRESICRFESVLEVSRQEIKARYCLNSKQA